MFYCYILFSEKLDKYYIGSTGNLEGRLQRHNSSNQGFTSTGKPWVIKYFETFETKTEAIIRELELKKWKNRTFIEDLINNGKNSLIEKGGQLSWFGASRFHREGRRFP